MAWFAAAADAAATLGSAVIKSEGQSDPADEGDFVGAEASPGFHSGGNASLGKGAPKDARPGPIDRFLGTPKGVLGTQVAGQFLGDYRQRRNSRNRFKDLKNEGLTPQEIAGSSGGGAVQATGNTLGSGPQQQAAHQQAFQADQADKERKNRLDVERLRQGPKAAASRQVSLAENIQPVQIQKLHRDMAHTLKQMEQIDFNMETAFPMKFATMAPENMLAAVVAARSGVDMEALLRGRKVTPEQRQAMDEMFEMTQVVLAKTRRELRGTMDVIKEVAAYSFDNVPKPPAPDATKMMEMLMNLFERDPSETGPRGNIRRTPTLNRKYGPR